MVNHHHHMHVPSRSCCDDFGLSAQSTAPCSSGVSPITRACSGLRGSRMSRRISRAILSSNRMPNVREDLGDRVGMKLVDGQGSLDVILIDSMAHLLRGILLFPVWEDGARRAHCISTMLKGFDVAPATHQRVNRDPPPALKSSASTSKLARSTDSRSHPEHSFSDLVHQLRRARAMRAISQGLPEVLQRLIEMHLNDARVLSGQLQLQSNRRGARTFKRRSSRKGGRTHLAQSG